MEIVNFTAAAIEGLPVPPKGRVRYKDAGQRSLIVAVSAGGSRVFYVLKRHRGTLHEQRIGPFPEIKVPEARRLAGEMIAAIERGEDPAPLARRRGASETFGSLFAWWLEVHAKPRRRTWRAAETLYQRELAGTVGMRPVQSITRAEVTALHVAIAQGVAARGRHGDRQRFRGQHTANAAIQLLGGVIRYAIKQGRYAGPDPTAGVEPFALQARERRLTADELPRFFAALDRLRPDMRDFMLLSLFTGARRMNVLSMRWADLDLDGGEWRIPRTKSGRPQLIPLEAEEVRILRARKAGPAGKTAWVFPARKGGRSEHRVQPDWSWTKLCREANLPDLRLHDLRRSLGSWMADTGASLPMIGKTLGHTSPSATAIYARLALDPIREAKRRAHAAMRDQDP